MSEELKPVCRNCKHWGRDGGENGDREMAGYYVKKKLRGEYRECQNDSKIIDKSSDYGGGKVKTDDCFIYWDGPNGWSAAQMTGANFGCVHFSERNHLADQ